MSTQLSGAQEQQLHEALIDAFPSETELAQMVRFGGVTRNLAAIAGGRNLSEVVFNLLVWAGARSKVDDLLIAARNANPDNVPLRAFAETRNLAATSPSDGELEALVLKSVRFHDVEMWRATMSRRELPVCRVEVPGVTRGTGFLIGPDLLLTNYHVLRKVISGEAVQQLVKFRFDFKRTADGTPRDGVTYGLAGGDGWLVDQSPNGSLDYALVRVAGAPGNQPVAGQQQAPKRGWLTPTAHTFTVGEPIFLLPTPGGRGTGSGIRCGDRDRRRRTHRYLQRQHSARFLRLPLFQQRLGVGGDPPFGAGDRQQGQPLRRDPGPAGGARECRGCWMGRDDGT